MIECSHNPRSIARYYWPGLSQKNGIAHSVIAMGWWGSLPLSPTGEKGVVVLREYSLYTELIYHAKLHVM
jgi:hypothetical protein